MPEYRRAARAGRILPPVALLLLFACSTPPDSPPRPSPDRAGDATGVGPHPLPPQTRIDATPAALVNGKLVEWGEMRAALTEAAGATVLQEIVDDRLVAAAAERAGLSIGTAEVEAERRFFYRSLADDPDQAVRLAQQLRERQGLGRTRFARLLLRTATLRALVRDQVTVNDESVQRMHESIHGPKRQGRLIVVASLAGADAVTQRLGSGEAFADVAVEVSTDASAARGGLLEPISRVDPRYPEVLRQALWSLEPGGISNPVLLENGYAIVALLREIDGDGTELADDRERLEELVRLEQERILMDRLLRQLRTGVAVTVIDEALQESWEWRQRSRSN